MKLEVKDLPYKARSLIRRLSRFRLVIFIVFFALLYGFLTQRIDVLTSREPDESDVVEELQTVKRPKIDESAAQKIQQLEAQNIEVKTLFDQARQNPFAE